MIKWRWVFNENVAYFQLHKYLFTTAQIYLLLQILCTSMWGSCVGVALRRINEWYDQSINTEQSSRRDDTV